MSYGEFLIDAALLRPFPGLPYPLDLQQTVSFQTGQVTVWRPTDPNLRGSGPTSRAAWLNLQALESAEMHEDRDF